MENEIKEQNTKKNMEDREKILERNEMKRWEKEMLKQNESRMEKNVEWKTVQKVEKKRELMNNWEICRSKNRKKKLAVYKWKSGIKYINTGECVEWIKIMKIKWIKKVER